MKDFFVAKQVTEETLIEMAKLSILDFICGQFDRHSGNFVVHFDKYDNAKFIFFDNDSNFAVNMSESAMKQMCKEKVLIVPKSFVINLLIFGARYEEYTKPDLEAQIGKVGDFENGQDTSLAVRETEKRIIMSFNRIFAPQFTTIKQVIDFCNKVLKDIYNNVRTNENENDVKKIIQGIEDDLSNPNKRTQLMSYISISNGIGINTGIVIDDDKISVKDHGRLFLRLEPNGWFKRLLYKFFDYIKYVFYQKKGNLLSATHWQTKKYLIEKRLPKVDRALILNEKNKIENCKLKKDDSINLSTETNTKHILLNESEINTGLKIEP